MLQAVRIAYMATLSERAKTLVEMAGSVTALANIAGIRPPSISDWINGKTQSIKGAPAARITKHFGLNPMWVTEGIGPMRQNLLPSSDTNTAAKSGESDAPKTPHEDDYALIPQFHVNGSCGDGYMNDHVEIRGGLAFKRDWLARMNIDPGQASVIYARGDSMAPTLSDGEVMLIDGRLIDPQSGKVYVIAVDGDLRVKRLFKRPAGWALVSDNQDKARYPDEPLASLGDIRVLGRVVWRGGGM